MENIIQFLDNHFAALMINVNVWIILYWIKKMGTPNSMDKHSPE